jgi:hypothetical protein
MDISLVELKETYRVISMKALVVIIVMIGLAACAANISTGETRSGSGSVKKTAAAIDPDASETTRPIKSPHGYIIDQDYEPGRFGGFIGDCTDDQNWPYYWQCMSENAGNGGLK